MNGTLIGCTLQIDLQTSDYVLVEVKVVGSSQSAKKSSLESTVFHSMYLTMQKNMIMDITNPIYSGPYCKLPENHNSRSG